MPRTSDHTASRPRVLVLGGGFGGVGAARELSHADVDGAAEHAHPLYTLPDAIRLRNHVLERWEAADRDPALVEDGALSVVIVGGGATGIESAGAMAELYRSIFSKDYPNLPQESARI